MCFMKRIYDLIGKYIQYNKFNTTAQSSQWCHKVCENKIDQTNKLYKTISPAKQVSSKGNASFKLHNKSAFILAKSNINRK